MYYLSKSELLLIGTDCSQCEEVKDLQKSIPEENGSDQSQL